MLKRLLDHLGVIHVFSSLGYVLPEYVSRIIPAAFFASPQNQTAKRLKSSFFKKSGSPEAKKRDLLQDFLDGIQFLYRISCFVFFQAVFDNKIP